MTLRDLYLRLRAIVRPQPVERELDEELAFHIDREAARLAAAGADPAEAQRLARRRFGSVALVADQCRDERRTAFVDTTVRDVKYAFREFRRAPLTAFTITATIALGLGIVAVVFMFYSAMFLRADDVPEPDRLFEVRRPPEPGAGAWVAFTRPDYEALRSQTTVFTDSVAMLNGVAARVDGRTFNGTLVTSNFFETIGAAPLLGRTLGRGDDEQPGSEPVIVLSHRGWTQFFERDPNVVGRSVELNGHPYQVVGVMAAGFRGLGITPPDFWTPLGRLSHLRQSSSGKEDSYAIDIVGRLKPDVSVEAATAALSAWAVANPALKEAGGRPKSIRLVARRGSLPISALDGLLGFAPLFLAFGLILLIGCANVANLLLARGLARQREIGIRLSLGASRRLIIRQLLTESLLLASVSAAGGLLVARLTLDAAVRVATAVMPPELSELISLAALAADWRVFVFLAGGAVFATVLFGLAPAIQSTRVELIRTMRGEITRDARPGRARNALVAVQVSASALLLIAAAVFLRGMMSASAAQPGLRTQDTVLLEMTNEHRRAGLLQAVGSDSSVALVGAAWPFGIGGTLAEANGVPVEFKFASPEYFEVFGLTVVRGRLFTKAERQASAGVVVISETVARRIWPDRDAVGQTMTLDPFERKGVERLGQDVVTPELSSRSLTVVGVVRDARVGHGMFEMVDAGVYVPIDASSAGASLVLRVNGDPDQARRALIERLTPVDPAMGRITTVRTMAGFAGNVLALASSVAVALGVLALGLTVSGLYSVLSYVVARRTREIGVRMALGATKGRVARLVLSQSFGPVGVGIGAGAALAALLAAALLSTSASAEINGMVRVFDPLAYLGSAAAIVVACAIAAAVPAIRAARIDPMTTLKQE
ncbi:MAG: ABC transporter permease [Acidobacteria bacterium]|nr:ABC transporter permease [Acidobacteriota bacterium]